MGVSFSILWKFTPNWSIAVFYNYLFNTKYMNNLFTAIQYDTCSWTIRLLAFQYINNKINYTDDIIINHAPHNTYVIQFELKGVGSVTKTLLEKKPGHNQ